MATPTFLLAFGLVLPPSNIVVLGPGSSDVQLIVGKLAKQSGYGVTAFVRNGMERRGEKLMYGPSRPPEEDRVRFATASTQMGLALASADAIILCAEGGGTTGIANTLRYAPRVQRVVLLTAIGGSKGLGGYPYGPPEAVTRCEAEVRTQVADTQATLSIVRIGVLKGGGAVGDNCDHAVGLHAQSYYDSLTIGGYPTPDHKVAVEYDKSMRGVSVTSGDEVEVRNPMRRSQTRTMVAPIADEISRVNAAAALLACLRQPLASEISLSAKAMTVEPTAAEWDAMLSGVAADDCG